MPSGGPAQDAFFRKDTGFVFGLAQGALVELMRLPSMVITLATFRGIQGVSLLLRPQAGGRISDLLGDAIAYPVLSVPAGIATAALTVVGLQAVLSRTGRGRAWRATGSDLRASHVLGVRSGRVRLAAFALAGLLTGCGGLVLASQAGIDERVWVPMGNSTWFRPLLLHTVEGYWTSLLRVRSSGVVSCHRHPAPVHGYVIKGSWRYLEHDWIATEGSYVFEPPGETHTLVVDEHVDEMITWFMVNGAMLYVDEDGKLTGYADVFQRIDMCREHYIKVGLGADYIDQFIR